MKYGSFFKFAVFYSVHARWEVSMVHVGTLINRLVMQLLAVLPVMSLAFFLVVCSTNSSAETQSATARDVTGNDDVTQTGENYWLLQPLLNDKNKVKS
jgi:hypothetical protein